MLPSLARAGDWTDAGVEVTLIDPQRWLYYSGMVPEHLGVAGGGAAGIEVSLNVTRRFQAAGRLADLDLTIVERDDRILSGFPDGMKR